MAEARRTVLFDVTLRLAEVRVGAVFFFEVDLTDAADCFFEGALALVVEGFALAGAP